MATLVDAATGTAVATGDADTASERASARTRLASRVVLAVSVAVWIASLNGLAHAALSQYGLLARGPGLLAATLGVAVAFCLAIRAGADRDAAAAIVAFIAVTRATSSIILGLPLFTWTFKHIGVVDHLSTSGSLARQVDIYNSWPGFFSAAAWFTDLTGVSYEDVARWFPVVTDVATVLGMYVLSRAYGQTVRVALVAAFGIQALNWVGQDYYSPQAVAFVLSLAALALLLRSRQQPWVAWLTVPLFIAITVTHQLTPFWLCGIAVLLGLTRRVGPRWIAGVYLLIAFTFVLVNLKALTPYGLLTGFDPLSNAQSNVPTAGNAGRSFTSLAARGTSGLMWLCAALCAIRARRRREPVWVPAVIAFTSFALLAGQSYGGEAIFRVFLYSMPGCLLLIAPVGASVLAPVVRTGTARRLAVPRRRIGHLVAVGVAFLAIGGSLQAYYGTFFINVVDKDGLVAERRLLDTAPTNSLLVPLSTGIAERPNGRYADFAAVDRAYDNALILQPGILQSSFRPAEVATLTRNFQDARRPVYVVLTRQMENFCTYYGFFPVGAVDRLVRALSASPQWTTLTHTPTLAIFELDRG